MPRKRIESKRKRRDDVLSRPDGWLVFLLGWCANEDSMGRHQPFFESMEDMREYYFENKARVIAEMGNTTDFWAWHKFEEHDRDNCDYCQVHKDMMLES